ncbi:MAG: sugar-binding domain-containing protein [Candidatus Sumerlaeaceae bacterium]
MFVRSTTLLLLALSGICCASDWKPTSAPIMTRWAKDVSPANVHPEYPRPQMVRKEWQNLNGLWDLAIVEDPTSGVTPQPPQKFDHKILVPFPVESSLSGIGKRAKHVWYRRSFDVPKEWTGRRVMLNFEAVDYESRVLVNGKNIGQHRGGYDPFSFDITNALTSGTNELLVGVYDPTDQADQPRGKQVTNPRGIWYTPSTGIWQTVWMEPVNKLSISHLELIPDVNRHAVSISAVTREGVGTAALKWKVSQDGKQIAHGEQPAMPEQSPKNATTGGAITSTITLPAELKLWSPESPTLYDLQLSLEADGGVVDEVVSYFGMRKLEIKSDGKFQRIFLNDKPIFQMGPLDQGFWPDGLHTAPTDEALRWDIEMTKRLGFNMTRKHIKVEPRRWYYWADKLGILVWQDMVSGNNKTPESKQQYEAELKRMIDTHCNHPSIIMWVVFNEGWGQYDKENTARLVEQAKKWDPTRLVNNASGWIDMACGDVKDAHRYPGPGAPDPETTRASVLGEFGGLGLPVQGHTWSQQGNWGYQGTSDRENLMNRYEQLMRRVWLLKEQKGLCAAVYTQITDVEIETNGLITYDREVVKVDEERIRNANTGKLPPIEITEVVPTSEKQGINWRYTFDKPAKEWNTPAFDDSGWKEGPAGFGKGDPSWPIRTAWHTKEIWLRRDIEIPAGIDVNDLYLNVFHDEDVEVYLNGERAVRERFYRTDYEEMPIGDKARATIKPGKNKIAVYCKNAEGGQYIDVGLIAIRTKK